ncbi:hypothetical protein HY489_02700 [Candidatus Woesearchaeota archaeon]|nr:hypothetical protein [Candidatus Woesearchaeota archaeon]
MTKNDDIFSGPLVWVIAIAAVLILFNQIQLYQLSTMLGTPVLPGSTSTIVRTFSGGDLKEVDVNNIKSTPQAVAAVVDLSGAKDAQSVINAMIPQGTPDYGKDLGISYDDPVTALQFLAYKLYPAIKQDVQQNNPDVWQRYLNLATKPVGISCEYCCGVGPVSITAQGQLTCGCSHAPAIHAITLYLMKNTDMNDAEVLREVMRWKALWFPKNMVEIGMKLAGGDSSVLADVPSMVGGC